MRICFKNILLWFYLNSVLRRTHLCCIAPRMSEYESFPRMPSTLSENGSLNSYNNTPQLAKCESDRVQLDDVSEATTDDNFGFMMSGNEAAFTRSDSELTTPQTTITSATAPGCSLPHIIGLKANTDNNVDESEPGKDGTRIDVKCFAPLLSGTTSKSSIYQRFKDKFAVFSIPETTDEAAHSRLSPNTLAVCNGKTPSGVSSVAALARLCNGPNGCATPLIASDGSVQCQSSNDVKKESLSEKEHHRIVREQHRKTRTRHFTDPVDFDGILHIIGGCGWWQIWVYFLISLQQVPHAMFNLSIIFMMFKPTHWCYIKDLDASAHSHITAWTSDQIRNIAIPLVYNEKIEKDEPSSCSFYNRDYHDIAHMNFANASVFLREENASARAFPTKCANWSYDETVMKRTIVTEWNLVCDENLRRADAHLAYALGYFIGCLLSGLSSDRFGRKPTVIGYGILASVFGLLLPYSTYFPVFLLIRFLGAVCNEAADLAAYVLCMEITGAKHRSAIGSLLQVPWAGGYCLLVAVAYMTKNWRTIQIITAALHTVTVLLICVLPESPRWLIVNSRVREAETIIRKACRMNNCTLPPDLEIIKHAERRKWVKRNKRATILHLLKSKELIIRTLIIFTIWIVTALVYYGVTLNLSDQSAPTNKMFSGDFFVNNTIAAVIEFPVILLCIFLLEAGRKKSQLFTLCLSGGFMLGVVLSPAYLNWLKLTFMLLGKASIQAAFIILYVFTSEMYPTVVRNTAVGTASMVARTGAGIASYVAVLSDITQPYVPMVIFGVCAWFAGVLVLFLPETLGKNLPETLHDAVTMLRPDTHYVCHAPNKLSQCEDSSEPLKDSKKVRMSSNLPETFDNSNPKLQPST